MHRRVLLLFATLTLSVFATACASSERPEVVPGSTIVTSSTTSQPPETTASGSDGDEPADTDTETKPSTTSIARLDPNDPDYPTTSPPAPRPTVSYPVAES